LAETPPDSERKSLMPNAKNVVVWVNDDTHRMEPNTMTFEELLQHYKAESKQS
jgi:hypothetical protein